MTKLRLIAIKGNSVMNKIRGSGGEEEEGNVCVWRRVGRKGRDRERASERASGMHWFRFNWLMLLSNGWSMSNT